MRLYRADDLVLAEMRKRGDRKFTHREIAAAVGCTPQTICNVINRLKREGIDVPRSRGGAISVASKLYREIKARGPGNYSVSELSEAIGASYGATRAAEAKLVEQGYIQREKARGRRAALLFSAALLLLSGTAIASPSYAASRTTSQEQSAADCLRKRRRIASRGRRAPEELLRSPKRTRRNRRGRAVFFAPDFDTKLNTTPPHTPRVRKAYSQVRPLRTTLCVRDFPHRWCSRPDHDEIWRKFRSRGMAARLTTAAAPPGTAPRAVSDRTFRDGAYQLWHPEPWYPDAGRSVATALIRRDPLP